jgi:hypothetical protein
MPFQGVIARSLGLSRHWGDDSMSDTIGQYVAGWRIADAVGLGLIGTGIDGRSLPGRHDPPNLWTVPSETA